MTDTKEIYNEQATGLNRTLSNLSKRFGTLADTAADVRVAALNSGDSSTFQNIARAYRTLQKDILAFARKPFHQDNLYSADKTRLADLVEKLGTIGDGTTADEQIVNGLSRYNTRSDRVLAGGTNYYAEFVAELAEQQETPAPAAAMPVRPQNPSR